MTRVNRLAAFVLTIACLMWGLAAGEDGYEQASRLHKQGLGAAALTHLDAFLSQHPRDARARFLKGVILAEQNRTQDAIDVLTALSQDFPELPEPHNNLAVLYAGQGRYQDALRALEMAVRAYPGYAIAHENMGDVYAALAGQAYGKAAQSDTSNRTARLKLAQIQELLPAGAVAAAPQLAETRLRAEPAAVPSAPEPAAPAVQAGRPQPVAPEPPTVEPAKPPQRVQDPTEAVLATVGEWASAWAGKDVQKYLSFYAPDFRTPKDQPRGKWEAARRERLTTPRRIVVDVIAPKVTVQDLNHATVTFRQNYQADTYKSSGRKTLHLVRQGERWLIQRETITFR